RSLDVDVDAGGQVDAHERVHCLGRRVEDVDQPLVGAHLEVLTRILVLVRRADDAVHVLLGGQRHRADHAGTRAGHRLDDLARRGVDRLVVIGLEPDADLLSRHFVLFPPALEGGCREHPRCAGGTARVRLSLVTPSDRLPPGHMHRSCVVEGSTRALTHVTRPKLSSGHRCRDLARTGDVTTEPIRCRCECVTTRPRGRACRRPTSSAGDRSPASSCSPGQPNVLRGPVMVHDGTSPCPGNSTSMPHRWPWHKITAPPPVATWHPRPDRMQESRLSTADASPAIPPPTSGTAAGRYCSTTPTRAGTRTRCSAHSRRWTAAMVSPPPAAAMTPRPPNRWPP